MYKCVCVYACICMYGNRRKKPLGAFLNLIVLNSSWRQAALMAFFGSMRHVSHLEHLNAVMYRVPRATCHMEPRNKHLKIIAKTLELN